MRPKRVADCHPDRPNCALGMCKPCYYAQPDQVEKRRQWARGEKGRAYRQRRQADPEWRAWRKAHRQRPEYLEQERAYLQSAKGRLMRARVKWKCWLKRQYAITPADYDRLIIASQGRCHICSAQFEPTRRGLLAVDHCHDTGTVRGLLCGNCNRAIGQLGDDPERLRCAASYLERARLRVTEAA